MAKGFGLLCWGFKEVQEEIPLKSAGLQHSSNRVSGISTRTMHQSTTPSLSQIIWPRRASRQFLSLPKVQNLLPGTFGYSLSSRAVVMNWGDERCCDEGHWHAHTRGLLWGIQKVVGTVQVHWSRRRLLWSGLEFHVCTINKSAHTKNVWKLYIYKYIYIWNFCRSKERMKIFLNRYVHEEICIFLIYLFPYFVFTYVYVSTLLSSEIPTRAIYPTTLINKGL